MIDLTPSIHFEHDYERQSMRWKMRLDAWVWQWVSTDREVLSFMAGPEAFFNKIVFPHFIEAAVAEGFMVTPDGRLSHPKLETKRELAQLELVEKIRRDAINMMAHPPIYFDERFIHSIKNSPEKW